LNPKNLGKQLQHNKKLKKDLSFSDSEESDGSCLEKKFYRCGCLNHLHECGHKYHDYLGKLRE